MANGFGSLYIGASGLRSAQNALNTSANNLANADTKGYVREQVRFADRNYLTLQQSRQRINMQQSGLGVSIGDVVHARDIFIDKAYRQENGRQAFYEACYTTVTQSEDILQEMDGMEFKQSVMDLNRAFQELAKAPADSTYQNLVLQKAELFVSRSRSIYADFQSYQSNLNRQIEEDVNRVNEIGDRIYELNLYIQKVEAGGVETAMTYRDERDALLDELSGYAKIEAYEDQTGFVRVELEGTDFIEDRGCNRIGLKEEKGTGFYLPYWPQLSDLERAQYVPVFQTRVEISTENNNDIGSIKAKLYQRGDDYAHYSSLLDEDSYSEIQDCVMMEMQAEIDLLFHNVVTQLNDLFAPNITAENDITDTAGNVVIPAGTKLLDTEHCAVGVDGELPPQELFQRIGCERYTKVTVDGQDYYVYNEEDPEDTSTMYQIGSVQINGELSKQITLMPAYTANGAVDYALGERMIQAWENKTMKINPYDQNPATFEGFYDKMMDKLGTDGSVYGSASDSLSGAAASLDNKRLQVTGVSSDEELTQMIKYQSAYNAASRYITVISQMTELIVTGLI